MTGWIKLYRSIRENWLWDDQPFDKRSAWIDILMMVNHKPRKTLLGNEIIEVDRGERVTSIRNLCERWGWSNTKVYNFLKLLEEDEMIEVKSDTKKTTVKVLNYEKYQGSNNGKNDSEATEKRRKNDAKATQKHTNKNVKNVKNEKKITEIWDFYCSTFEGIYNARKLSKKRKGHINARLESFSLDEIKKAVSNIRESDWHIGKNPNGKVYATPDFIFRNDEKVEEWLNYEPEEEEELQDLSLLRDSS